MSNPILGINVITDRSLCNWIRCKRKAWLDLYEVSEKKVWSPHRALQLDHQYKSISAFTKQAPGRGKESCKRGNQEVVGLRLHGKGPSDLKLEAHPPLLHKITGQSCWGNFQYIPVTTRLGQRVTREHRLSLALWGYLLEELQQTRVKYGLVISIKSHELTVQRIESTKKVQKELFDTLKKVYKDLSKKEPPPVIADRKKCNTCSWKRLCDKKAHEQGDLSEINGVGVNRKKMLLNMGISNINELANIDSNYLKEKFKKLGKNQEEFAEKIIQQAIVQKNSKAKRLSKQMVLPELESTQGVLIYDIESDPDARHDFLHGFVSIKRRANGKWFIEDAKYDPILNIKKTNQDIIWMKLKSKIESFNNWPILHYGETEILSFHNLAKQQGESEESINHLKKNFIDIHSRLREGWLLPVKSYSLKTIANWMDFQWSKNGASGAKALVWWRQIENSLLENKQSNNQLKWIIEYNKEDCIATWKIAQWIIDKK